MLGYRPNVCILLFNKERKLLLGERDGSPGEWQFPQGGIEEGISEEDNIYRELKEELGIDRASVRLAKKLHSTHQYDFRVVPDYARGKWRGQDQIFWLVEFLGADTEIDVAQVDPEFSGWRWCDADEVERWAAPHRFPGYTGPLREFKEFLQMEPGS